MTGSDYLVGIQQISDSDSETTVAQFSPPQECRLSECEPESAWQSMETISSNQLIYNKTVRNHQMTSQL